ncbi:NAD(P)-dependent oxidoreductase [Desulfoscipio gibsoniae]|uniref:Lactate dehydrogenase-like oxidoreductase n=1 Tax=Desulfoscipio gibsoniae DSM 7213 TaxID=767817 RepID=R4KV94_9FIRM|nr:NAD(P)-dependent oxidoreductase [Desulfoscipio gibsoniae]AGL03511.1 lactate dehydrogenase-like oxidoreductase [Desulfoscipio gibsoniae DSM 7213]
MLNMPKVVSLVPEVTFKAINVSLTKGWEFKFMENYTENDVILGCRDADFLLAKSGFSIKMSRRIIENIPSIKLIQMDGVGYDTVDIQAAAEHKLPVSNNAGQNAGPVAELTIATIVALQRQIFVSDRDIKNNRFKNIREQLLAKGLAEIQDSRLGLVGFGAIGREVARFATMMGAKVSYYDVFRASQNIEEEFAVEYKPLDEILAFSDIISIHVPLTERTVNLIGEREFGLMCPGALFINTSRGEVVDQEALAAVLESNYLGGAAMDCISPEPPPPEHPLLNLSPEARDRLLLTPHTAGVTRGAFRRMLLNALDNMNRVAKGEAPRFVVNGIKQSRMIS